MKSIFFIALVCLLAGGCSDSGVKAQVNQFKQHQRRQERANQVVNDILYIKDPRTSICYAYYWNGLATVPIASIPTNLLFIANIQPNK